MKFAADFFGAGDQGGGIAGAARGLDTGDVTAGDAAGRGDDFADAEAGAVAEIVDALIGLLEGSEYEEMSLGKVVDVDVVADASAVRGGIVGAKDMNWTGGT